MAFVKGQALTGKACVCECVCVYLCVVWMSGVVDMDWSGWGRMVLLIWCIEACCTWYCGLWLEYILVEDILYVLIPFYNHSP